MHEVVIIHVYFLHPRYFFTVLRICTGRTVCPIFVVYGSKDMFSRHLRPFWGANKFFFYIFSLAITFSISQLHVLHLCSYVSL